MRMLDSKQELSGQWSCTKPFNSAMSPIDDLRHYKITRCIGLSRMLSPMHGACVVMVCLWSGFFTRMKQAGWMCFCVSVQARVTCFICVRYIKYRIFNVTRNNQYLLGYLNNSYLAHSKLLCEAARRQLPRFLSSDSLRLINQSKANVSIVVRWPSW